ncbi:MULTISPECIES: helix-turn-helix transcriptional regulator [Lacrimispora]|jgi:transcriptional regulator with XRE-family HTH domain|uniref:helix-turn-helix domain-containing protein n=1 Tax=Lacrimispora TaxID=2719231 RepID=UPI000BE373DA|nr:helix-turn-helix transcriptional regulator [Lacrimispora amygdalina]MDK2965745.1 hypothetical protein [Lacrimispora sp.]
MSITGQRIKKRRKQLGMRADDVASLLGVSRSTVFRYENGNIEKVPANVLEKLAEILKTTPDYLIGCQNYFTDNSHWQSGTFKPEDGILLKESYDDNYRTGDNGAAAITEIYLTLTEEEKKKAYDFLVNLSRQPIK